MLPTRLPWYKSGEGGVREAPERYLALRNSRICCQAPHSSHAMEHRLSLIEPDLRRGMLPVGALTVFSIVRPIL